MSRLQLQSELQAVKMFLAQQAVHRFEREVPKSGLWGGKRFIYCNK